MFVRGTVLSKADVPMESMKISAATHIVRVEHHGCIDFPEGEAGTLFTRNVCRSKKTFRREFAASHPKHGEVHSYKQGVKVKAVFGPNVKNPAERDRTVFYDAAGQPTRVEWGNQTTAPFRWNAVQSRELVSC